MQMTSSRRDDGVLLITLDSCRYDTFSRTKTPVLDKVGPLHKAHAPSYFTYGSHAAIFKGFLPGLTSREVFLNSKYSKVFRISHAAFSGQPGSEAFELNGNSIVTGLRRQGYATFGSGAMNWFDPKSESGKELGADFEQFHFTGNSWSLADQLKWIESKLSKEISRPAFVFLNVGETHVPYWHQGANWSREDNPCVPFQRRRRRRDCRKRQSECLKYADRLLEPLISKFAAGTIIVCADHGDCWGEGGLWEHGISHKKTLEVPLLMRVRGRPIFRKSRKFWK